MGFILEILFEFVWGMTGASIVWLFGKKDRSVRDVLSAHPNRSAFVGAIFWICAFIGIGILARSLD